MSERILKKGMFTDRSTSRAALDAIVLACRYGSAFFIAFSATALISVAGAVAFGLGIVPFLGGSLPDHRVACFGIACAGAFGGVLMGSLVLSPASRPLGCVATLILGLCCYSGWWDLLREGEPPAYAGPPGSHPLMTPLTVGALSALLATLLFRSDFLRRSVSRVLVTIKTKTKLRLKLILLCVSVIVLLGLVPLPFKSDAGDKAQAVTRALEALQGKTTVLTDKGWRYLNDNEFVKDFGRLYYTNDLGIPDTVFSNLHMRPIPRDRKLNVDNGDVVVSFSSRDVEGKQTDYVQFAYIFGTLGAQGYEIRIYKSLLIHYYVFKPTWQS